MENNSRTIHFNLTGYFEDDNSGVNLECQLQGSFKDLMICLLGFMEKNDKFKEIIIETVGMYRLMHEVFSSSEDEFNDSIKELEKDLPEDLVELFNNLSKNK